MIEPIFQTSVTTINPDEEKVVLSLNRKDNNYNLELNYLLFEMPGIAGQNGTIINTDIEGLESLNGLHGSTSDTLNIGRFFASYFSIKGSAQGTIKHKNITASARTALCLMSGYYIRKGNSVPLPEDNCNLILKTNQNPVSVGTTEVTVLSFKSEEFALIHSFILASPANLGVPYQFFISGPGFEHCRQFFIRKTGNYPIYALLQPNYTYKITATRAAAGVSINVALMGYSISEKFYNSRWISN